MEVTERPKLIRDGPVTWVTKWFDYEHMVMAKVDRDGIEGALMMLRCLKEHTSCFMTKDENAEMDKLLVAGDVDQLYEALGDLVRYASRAGAFEYERPATWNVGEEVRKS